MTRDEVIKWKIFKDSAGIAKLSQASDVAIKVLEQEPKTGHWVDKTHQSGCGVIFYRVECSECGKASGLSHTSAEYCPHCGAKMVEPQNLKYADNDTMMPAT